MRYILSDKTCHFGLAVKTWQPSWIFSEACFASFCSILSLGAFNKILLKILFTKFAGCFCAVLLRKNISHKNLKSWISPRVTNRKCWLLSNHMVAILDFAEGNSSL